MKISRGFALASLMTLAASPVFAQFSLSDAANAISGMKGENAATAAAPTSETAGLLGSSGKAAGLDNALGNVKDTNDLNNAFSALGMDSGMIGQFAPVILQYLGQQGVGGSLLQSLGGIWGAGS